MGITTEELFENIYNVIFSPKHFFENDNMNVSTRLGASIIIVMTVLNKFAYAITNKTVNDWTFIFPLIWGIICAIIMWFVVALCFEYIAKIFDRGGFLQKILYMTAFATIPAIFFAPLNLLKHLGEVGYIVSVILGCLLYCWIIVLYAYAIKSTYKITFARAFMLIFLPLISSILAIYQLVGFYNKMWYIFSI